MNLYCIRDTVTGAFDKYFVAGNVEEAKRVCYASLAKHPFVADMSLYVVPVVLDSTSGYVSIIDDDIKASNYGFTFVSNLLDIINGFGDRYAVVGDNNA